MSRLIDIIERIIDPGKPVAIEVLLIAIGVILILLGFFDYRGGKLITSSVPKILVHGSPVCPMSLDSAMLLNIILPAKTSD